MKNILTLLLLFSGLQLAAQTSPATDTLNRQIGINATNFLGQIFRFTPTNSFNNPVYYIATRKKKGKGYARFGAGGELLLQGTGGGTTTNIILNLRFGKDKAVDFGKRWQAYYGYDFKTNIAFSSFGSSTTNSTQVALGIAPVVGLQFKINSRLSVSSESAYNFFLTLFDQGGDTNFGFLTSFSAPTSVFLNYHF